MKSNFYYGLASILLSFAISHSNAQSGLTVPRKQSPAATISQTIGISEITVNYSRPNVVSLQGRDRTDNIWGKLVPYGLVSSKNFGAERQIPWRAGANENTTIHFTHDVLVEGKKLKAGKYGLHIIVKENNDATIIFSNNFSSWGSFTYDEAEDALRVDIKTQEIPLTKILTYGFIDYTEKGTVLALDWEKKRFPISLEFDVHAIALQSFRDQLRSSAAFSYLGLLDAARYCANSNINHEEALKWIDMSIASNKNYQNLSVKIQLLFQTGDEAKFDEAVDECASIANAAQLNNLGYQMANTGKLIKAIDIFKLMVERDPKDPNAHDSLGEAYKMAGEKALAIKSFKKSLSLNPPQNVKDNSLFHLKELGVKL